MTRQIIFELDDSQSFFKLTTDYFSKAGFRKTGQTENQLFFEKGSALRNMVTFNPLNWKSAIRITLQDNIVVADFDINTIGQLVTLKEEKLWDIFITNYKKSITDQLDLSAKNQRHLRETKRDSLKYVKWALIGALVFGVPFAFLAYLTGIDTLASMGAAIGAVSFMSFKINEERRKNERGVLEKADEE